MDTFNKCRVCICALNATNNIYDMQKLPLLSHKFVTCTNLSVAGEDRLPTVLCQACYDLLEQLYDFRARCIAADRKWRMEILALFKEEQHESKDDEKKEEKKQAENSVVAKELELSKEKRESKRLSRKLQRFNTVEKIEICRTKSPQQVEDKEKLAEQCSAVEQSGNIYKCDLCTAQFLNEQRLQTHKRRHGELPYPCPEAGCDRGYSHKNTLTLHMRKCHKLGKEHKLHVCEFCGKVFDTMSQLRNHSFTHQEKSELPYACEEANCERRFASKQLLKVHQMRHAGIKNYTCSFCGVQKTTRTELKIHMNYHTLDRTYSCRFCSKVCYSSSNLNKHMRTVHERARNYACKYCERTFTQPAICKQHELIHTGEKPHECQDCGKHFRQKAALRTHNKIHRRQQEETTSFNCSPIEGYIQTEKEEIENA